MKKNNNNKNTKLVSVGVGAFDCGCEYLKKAEGS